MGVPARHGQIQLSPVSVAARMPSLGETMTLAVIECIADRRGHRLAHQIPRYLQDRNSGPGTSSPQ